jgi:hypothetical protein
MSKLVESLVNDIFLSVITPQLSEFQFGSREGRSTVDGILLLEHYILRGFERCEENKKSTRVATVFFDISKAFDSIPHDELLSTLQNSFHLAPNLLNLIQSYLSDRTLKGKVGEALSSEGAVTSGVSRGSILGPSLFLAYINSIASTPLSPGPKIILYVDDIVLIHPLWSDSSILSLQNDVDQISCCSEQLGLFLNDRKCQFMVVTLSKQSHSATIKLNGKPMT